VVVVVGKPIERLVVGHIPQDQIEDLRRERLQAKLVYLSHHRITILIVQLSSRRFTSANNTHRK